MLVLLALAFGLATTVFYKVYVAEIDVFQQEIWKWSLNSGLGDVWRTLGESVERIDHGTSWVKLLQDEAPRRYLNQQLYLPTRTTESGPGVQPPMKLSNSTIRTLILFFITLYIHHLLRLRRKVASETTVGSASRHEAASGTNAEPGEGNNHDLQFFQDPFAIAAGCVEEPIESPMNVVSPVPTYWPYIRRSISAGTHTRVARDIRPIDEVFDDGASDIASSPTLSSDPKSDLAEFFQAEWGRVWKRCSEMVEKEKIQAS